MTVLLVFVFFSAFRLTPLSAQDRQIKFEHFTREHGLLQSSITCILQDHTGFIWLGTYDGLLKYDGYNFTVYKNSPLDSTSLSDNGIFALHEDRAGTLWVGTFGGGLNQFDRDKKQFRSFVPNPKDPQSLSNYRVLAISEDSRGAGLWIGTGNGLNRFDRNTKKFTRFVYDAHDASSLSANEIRALREDSRKDGTLWIGTDNGLNRFDHATGKFTRFFHDPKNPHSLSDNRVWAIAEDHTGALWVGTQAGLNRLVLRGDFDENPTSDAARFARFVNLPNDPHSLSANDVRVIYESRHEAEATLWIGTWGGGLSSLNLANPATSSAIDQTREAAKFTRYVYAQNDPYSLSANRVLSIFEDRAGTLWIGTFGGRLNQHHRYTEKFTHVSNDPNEPQSLSHNYVRTFCEDQAGTLWLGTQDGLNQLERPQSNLKSTATQKFTHFFHVPDNPHSLSHDNVRALLADRTGSLWIGTDGGGLNKFDPETRRFTHHLNDPDNPRSLSHNRIVCLYEDHMGKLWIGTYGGGLNRWDLAQNSKPEAGHFTHFRNDPLDPNSLAHNRVWTVYEDRSQTLWIGTSGGLNKFDRTQEQFIRYVHDAEDDSSLSHNAVFAIYEDSRQKALWIGTYGGGLNKLDRVTGKFRHYTMQDGLPNDVIYGILEDSTGQLWLSTNLGLSRFDPRTETFRNYDETDGLQSYEFNAGAYYKNKKGEMFFGGVNGYNAFDPARVKDNPHVPPVVLTAFNVFDSAAKLEHALETLRNIRLSYNDNFFSFEFAALSFANSAKNQYAYKMAGVDRDWISSGTRRYASYTNLSPGEYVFHMKGSNHDGVWNETGAVLAVTITPPWWRTRGAYALYVLSLGLGIFVVDRIQRRRVLHKERSRAQIREAELRAQAAEAQAHALQSENERKRNVELLSEIGKEITASLDDETIFYRLYEHINRLADATIFGVGIYDPENGVIEYKLAMQNGKRYAPYTRDTNDKTQFPVWCIENRQPVFINDVAQEYHRYVGAYHHTGRLLEDGSRSQAPQSLIYLPLVAQDRVLGVITIQSFQKQAYNDYHLNILQNLAAYTTIALDNAAAYRRLDAALKHLQDTQQQLIAKEKLASLGMLTAGIAHEIKNPLNFVNNFAVLSTDLTKELRELLATAGAEIAPATQESIQEVLVLLDQNLVKINDHGKRADSIVKSMLLHSRGESSERRLADLNDILDEYVMLAFHSMRGQDTTFNIKIEKDYDATIGRVEVVPQDLCRAFLNLVNNACYATHEKRKKLGESFTPLLRVHTKNLGDTFEVRIADNGPGIPTKVLDKIFTPFFTTKPAGQGVGLGLSIVYDIIAHEHNGKIKIETQEGEGTAFVINLPRISA